MQPFDEALDDRVRRLEAQLEMLRTSQKKERPWYRTPSIIISLVALSASLVTTVYSSIRANIQETESIRNQLRATLVQASDLGVKAMELSQKYKPGDPQLSVTSQYLGAQNTILAKHAYYLVDKLGKAASSTDLLMVAYGLKNVNDLSLAEVLLKRAIEQSENITDKMNSLRERAALLFALNRIPDGVTAWQAAIDAASEALKNEPTSTYMKVEIVFSYLLWSEAAASRRECKKASDLLTKAHQHAQGVNEVTAWFPARATSLQNWLATQCSGQWPWPQSNSSALSGAPTAPSVPIGVSPNGQRAN